MGRRDRASVAQGNLGHGHLSIDIDIVVNGTVFSWTSDCQWIAISVVVWQATRYPCDRGRACERSVHSQEVACCMQGLGRFQERCCGMHSWALSSCKHSMPLGLYSMLDWHMKCSTEIATARHLICDRSTQLWSMNNFKFGGTDLLWECSDDQPMQWGTAMWHTDVLFEMSHCRCVSWFLDPQSFKAVCRCLFADPISVPASRFKHVQTSLRKRPLTVFALVYCETWPLG